MTEIPHRTYSGLAASRRLRVAGEDFLEGLGAVHLWGLLGWQDIRQRYHRSVLGPFWLTISAAIMVTAMGFLYSRIFGQDIAQYLPFLATGLILWLFVATVINESCVVFIGSDQMIKQIRLPLTIHVCRMLWRNVIILAHNFVIIVVIGLLYAKPSVGGMLLAAAGLAVVILNCLWAGLLLGILCARFRDVPPIIANVVQIAFFVTPILWPPQLLGDKEWLAYINPFFHLVESVRGPILGTAYYGESLALMLAAAVFGLPLTLLFFARHRARVPYWL